MISNLPLARSLEPFKSFLVHLAQNAHHRLVEFDADEGKNEHWSADMAIQKFVQLVEWDFGGQHFAMLIIGCQQLGGICRLVWLTRQCQAGQTNRFGWPCFLVTLFGIDT